MTPHHHGTYVHIHSHQSVAMTMAGEGGLNVVQSRTQRKKSEQVGCELSMYSTKERTLSHRSTCTLHTCTLHNMYLAMCSHTYMHTLLGLEVR